METGGGESDIQSTDFEVSRAVVLGFDPTKGFLAPLSLEKIHTIKGGGKKGEYGVLRLVEGNFSSCRLFPGSR